MTSKVEKYEQVTAIVSGLLEKTEPLRLSEGERQLMSQADIGQIACALGSLLRSGVDLGRIWRTWNRNGKDLPDIAEKMREKLPVNHVVCKILAEHQMALCFTADLDEANNEVQMLQKGGSINMEVRKLANIANWLAACKQHREREEEVILPELERRGHY